MFKVNAKKIRALMFAQKINISELASKAKLQNSSVSRLMTDGATANAQTIGKLAAALDVDGENLILKGDDFNEKV